MVRAQALLLARKRAWSEALGVLTSPTEALTETDELIGGLIAQLHGDDEMAKKYFRRAHWWPEWHRHGAEIWVELARRLDKV